VVIVFATYGFLGGEGCAGVGLGHEVGRDVALQLCDAALCSVNLLRQLRVQSAARVKVNLGRRIDGRGCLFLRSGEAGC